MSRPSFYIAAAFMLSSAGLKAANFWPTSPLIQLGYDTDIFFQGSASLNWTDNLYSLSNKTSAFSYTLRPGFVLEYAKDSELSAELSISRGFVRYFKSSLKHLDNGQDAIGGKIEYNGGGPLSVSINSSYSESARNDELAATGVSSTVFSTLVRTGNYNHGIQASYKLSEKTQISLGVTNSSNAYLNPVKATTVSGPTTTVAYNTNNLTELNTTSVPVGLVYRFPGDNVTAGLKYQYDTTDYSPAPYFKTINGVPQAQPALVNKKLTKNFLGLTLAGALTSSGKLTTSTQVGYYQSQLDNNPSRNGLSYSISLNHNFSEKVTHFLSLGRSAGPTSTGSESIGNTYAYGASYAYSDKTAFNLALAKTDNTLSTTKAGSTSFNLGVNYRYNSYLSLNGGYSLTQTNSGNSSPDFNTNAVNLSAAFKY
jgi:hypothetical protein